MEKKRIQIDLDNATLGMLDRLGSERGMKLKPLIEYVLMVQVGTLGIVDPIEPVDMPKVKDRPVVKKKGVKPKVAELKEIIDRTVSKQDKGVGDSGDVTYNGKVYKASDRVTDKDRLFGRFVHIDGLPEGVMTNGRCYMRVEPGKGTKYRYLLEEM